MEGSHCGWGHTPQEHQILDFGGVELGTKRFLPPPYWYFVTESHRRDLGAFDFFDANKFESKESSVETFGKLTNAKQVSDLQNVLIPYAPPVNEIGGDIYDGTTTTCVKIITMLTASPISTKTATKSINISTAILTR